MFDYLKTYEQIQLYNSTSAIKKEYQEIEQEISNNSFQFKLSKHGFFESVRFLLKILFYYTGTITISTLIVVTPSRFDFSLVLLGFSAFTAISILYFSYDVIKWAMRMKKHIQKFQDAEKRFKALKRDVFFTARFSPDMHFDSIIATEKKGFYIQDYLFKKYVGGHGSTLFTSDLSEQQMLLDSFNIDITPIRSLTITFTQQRGAVIIKISSLLSWREIMSIIDTDIFRTKFDEIEKMIEEKKKEEVSLEMFS